MAKNCPKGKACGRTCIRKTYKCRFEVPRTMEQKLDALMSVAKTELSDNEMRFIASLQPGKEVSWKSIDWREPLASVVDKGYVAYSKDGTKIRRLELDEILAKKEKSSNIVAAAENKVDSKKLQGNAGVVAKNGTQYIQKKLGKEPETDEDFEKLYTELHKPVIDKVTKERILDNVSLSLRNVPASEQSNVVKEMRSAMGQYVDLTGGEVLSSRPFVYDPKMRSVARPNEVIIGKGGSMQEMLYHEVTHVHDQVHKDYGYHVAMDFINQRKTSNEPKKLSEITSKGTYRETEVAYPGNFILPYVGKYYGKGQTTEVHSIGVQYFASPTLMKALHKRDPEYFNYTVGVIMNMRKRAVAKNNREGLE